MQAAPGEGRRLCPDRDAEDAREGCGQCPGGKEAAPGKGGRECTERAAGIQQRHRLLPGLWGGADGKRPSHVPPAVCWVQRRHPFPALMPTADESHGPGSGGGGQEPSQGAFPPPHRSLCSWARRFASSRAGPGPRAGLGLSLCPRDPEPGLVAAPTKGGTFLLQRLHFWVTPHGAFTCVLDRGKMLAAPPGTWSRPPGHAADGLPAPLRSWSSPQAPLRLPVTPASTEVSAQVWLSPSPGGSSAGLPPASSAPSAGKKHHLRAEEGVRGETQCHVPPGDGWRAQGQLVQPLCHPGASSRQRG